MITPRYRIRHDGIKIAVDPSPDELKIQSYEESMAKEPTPPPNPKPSDDDKRDVIRKDIQDRPDWYEGIDPNKPLPPSGDPRGPGKTN